MVSNGRVPASVVYQAYFSALGQSSIDRRRHPLSRRPFRDSWWPVLPSVSSEERLDQGKSLDRIHST